MLPTVLIVDDDPLLGCALSRILRGKAVVSVATTVAEGRKAISGDPNRFMLIAFDSCMPEEEGQPVKHLATLDLAKTTAPHFRGPMVAISDFSDDVQALLGAGCTQSHAKMCLHELIESLLTTAIVGA